MALTNAQTAQIGLLRAIYSVSYLLSTRTYIWAGLVQDVMTGRFLRDHGDVDGFTLNLWELRHDMAALFERRGYRVSFLEEFHILRIDGDGVHAGLNPLEVDGDTAMWRHIGDRGTLYFPSRWLSDTPLPFYDTQVFVSGVEFEYAIKTHPELLSPTWRGREEDTPAISWLEGALREQALSPKDVLRQVWSYNPFWVSRGYTEYAMPSVAWRLEPRQRARTGDATPKDLGADAKEPPLHQTPVADQGRDERA